MAKERRKNGLYSKDFEISSAEFRGEVTERLRELSQWKDDHTKLDLENFSAIRKELEIIKDKQNKILTWGATFGAFSGFVVSLIKDKIKL